MSGDYTARYWRHMRECAEPCRTLQEAVSYLANGWADADLLQISITGPGGAVILDGDQLLDEMTATLNRGDERRPA